MTWIRTLIIRVGRSALGFAELLGVNELPKIRPQLLIRHTELAEAERRWGYPALPPRPSAMRIDTPIEVFAAIEEGFHPEVAA